MTDQEWEAEERHVGGEVTCSSSQLAVLPARNSGPNLFAEPLSGLTQVSKVGRLSSSCL